MAGWSSNAGMSFQRTFEPNRDLISSVTNAWNATPISSFAYTNDDIGRRTVRVDSGLTQNSFGYNMRSELVNAIMGTNTYGYEFDPIGNRLTATNNTAVTTYFANELNQYTNIVSGASVTPIYDDDGNMLTIGNGWTATWDGENRLIRTVKGGLTIAYAYDHMGRRVSKTVGATTHAYVYDGWNLIAETDGTTAKRYVWGLDLSGSLQGAGGIGGLLSVSVAGGGDPGIFAPAYDANGNISEYVSLANGAIASHREYDAFGRVIGSTGAAPSAFGFSTKYTDAGTGLLYYGYRYYAPWMGRWLSRDPIGERGGRNLFVFCRNNALTGFDPFGLKTVIKGTEIKRYADGKMSVSIAPGEIAGGGAGGIAVYTINYAYRIAATVSYLDCSKCVDLAKTKLVKKGDVSDVNTPGTPILIVPGGDPIGAIDPSWPKTIIGLIGDQVGQFAGGLLADVLIPNVKFMVALMADQEALNLVAGKAPQSLTDMEMEDIEFQPCP
ncbi:MAG: RHS repeat-associated core domain-containing protein [Candidatus Hydrogenedentes bacterium]|nr:RHS repeat-associated core domain-containing protein [Candidatus Hydrogenedentota bacterium]